MRLSNTNEHDHAPGDVVDYGFSYASLLASGETITDSTWTATDGITLSSEQVDGAVASVVVSGGERGNIYYLTNTVVTSGTASSPEKTFNRVIVLSCKQL